jgi:hypothetical protein
MTRIWESVPQVSWTNDSAESEPSVVANVAATSGADSDPDSPAGSASVTTAVATSANLESRDSRAAVGSSPGGSLDVGSSPVGLSDKSNVSPKSPEAMSQEAIVEPLNDNEPAKALLQRAEPSNRREMQGEPIVRDEKIERLRAALNEDASRRQESSGPMGSSHDIRVRVESLLERSRKLFDLGHLTEARHAAQVARDLGDTARIDYSPDEERPVDLVNRIDDQLSLEETSEADHTGAADSKTNTEPSTSVSEKSTDSIPPANAPSDVRSTLPAGDERTTGRFRLGREWGYGMGVFRRDRKAPPTPQRGPEHATGPTEAVRVQIGFESSVDGAEDSTAAVVQANRGVTLSSYDVASPELADKDPHPDASNDPRVAASNSLRKSEESVADVSASRKTTASDSDDWPEIGGSSNNSRLPIPEATVGNDETRRLEIDALPPVPPEFDDVRPMATFHEVRPEIVEERSLSERNEGAVYSVWGWCAGIVGFSICGLVALTCYRRGAV